MSYDLPPLDDDISSLLDRDRLAEPFPPPGARERAFDAIMKRVEAAEAEAEATAPVPPAAPAPSRAISPIVTGLVGVLVGALVMGLVGLPKGTTTPATPSEIVYVPVDVPIAYPVRADAPAPAEQGPAKAGVSAPAPSASGDRLSAERNVLDAARVALASGEPNQAVALADRHKRDFPQGALVEEREAIATKALVDAGRHAEARARGAAFERRFPQSAMLRSVRSSLSTIGDGR
ncbi:MAG: hypothetical protein JNM74_19305 [Myxococcales bacterium]|nr:hypothetical protein [Myxococcales bacterium]